MTEHHADVEKIFASALAIDAPEQRAAYLAQACGNDRALSGRIDALLRANHDAGSFLEHPPAGLTATIATGEFETVNSGVEPTALDFLTPSQKANCLGTLGQYEAVEVVGRGGMGIVLRAYDTKLNRVVAIKVMAPELAANPMAVKRFWREARAAAAISHDHVVTIFAIEESHRPPFLAMEFVDGHSLQEKIDRSGAIEVREILRIGMQIARGLAAAHEQGLVHRDIKPANILLENGVERVKLTDFGLARAVDDVSVTQTGQIAGTPQFMSPEQAQGLAIDARSDLFSLGSVLYTMCTGRPPFRAESAVAMLRRVTDDKPRAIEEVNSETPDWLEAIIFKLLEKEPAHRFQSAAEVAELLGQHLAHLQHPATARRPVHIVQRQTKHDIDEMLSFVETSQRVYAVVAIAWAVLAIAFAALGLSHVGNYTATFFSLNALSALITGALSGVTGSIALLGSRHVARREAYRWAVAGNIAALLPVNPILVFAAPWSIAAIVKLRHPDVRREFRGSRAATDLKPSQEGKDGNSTFFHVSDYVAIASLVLGILLAMAAVIYVVTDKGTLVVETNDPGVRVVIADDGETLMVLDTAGDPSRAAIVLRSGKYELRPYGDESVEISQNTVILRRGREVVVRVRRVEGRQSGYASTPPAFEARTAATETRISKVRQFEGHTGHVSQAAFFSDGRRVASVSWDTTIRIWDLKTGEELQRIETGKPLASMAISPDDKRIAVGVKGKPDATIEIWGTTSAKKLVVFGGHSDTIVRLAFTADGRRLMSASDDWSVRLWDLASYAALHEFATSSPDSTSLSPDGGLIAGRDRKDDDMVRLWSTESGKPVAQFDATKAVKVQRCDFSPDSRTLVTGSFLGLIDFWDVASGKAVRQLRAHRGPIFHIELTPDGQHVISSGMDRGLRLWNAQNGSLVAEIDTKPRYFKSLHVSPDGSRVAAAAAWAWNFETGRYEVDGEFDVHLYRIPQPVRPDAADVGTVPEPKNAPESVIKELDQLVELAESDVERVRRLVKNGVASTVSLLQAEAGAIEAKIRRAEARRDKAELVQLLNKLVELREQELQSLRALNETGVIATSEVQMSLKALLEAKVRLHEAQAKK